MTELVIFTVSGLLCLIAAWFLDSMIMLILACLFTVLAVATVAVNVPPETNPETDPVKRRIWYECRRFGDKRTYYTCANGVRLDMLIEMQQEQNKNADS